MITHHNGEILSNLIKELRKGESIASLFLQATNALGQLLNQPNVSEQIKKELAADYGMGLGNQEVMTLEIQEVQNRKARLEKSLESKGHLLKDDERKRLQNAIKEHEQEIKRLEALKDF